MGLSERAVVGFECPSCGQVWRHREGSCCGEPTERVERTVVYSPPERDRLAREVFGISSTELVICKVLMAEGEATVSELTATIPRDRSTISRHVNHLVELGVMEKRSQVVETGGRVSVYSPVSIDAMHRTLRLGLYAWLTEAEELLDELTEEKVRGMIEQVDVDSLEEDEPPVAASSTDTSERTAREAARSSLLGRLLGRYRP